MSSFCWLICKFDLLYHVVEGLAIVSKAGVVDLNHASSS